MTTLLALLLSTNPAWSGARVGGYVRVMARPDLQGGAGRLGYWNLTGRLMNEGPYAALDFDYDVLEPEVDTLSPWTTVHMRIEGGSVGGADPGNGRLDNFRLSQLHVTAGNVLLDRVTWKVGTLEESMGDLGLYDMRLSTIFSDTVGMSARVQHSSIDWLIGLGDAGYSIRDSSYNPVVAMGSSLRVTMGAHAQLGLGGQWSIESAVSGHTKAPYDTPDMRYEDWIRGEVIQTYRADHPISADLFPNPTAASASSGHIFGYMGFGGLGPLDWNSSYVRLERRHPDGPIAETWADETADIHATSFTDERTVLTIGNELQLTAIPERLHIAWGALYGRHTDRDNTIMPSEHSRWYASTVLRAQLTLTPTLAWLTESALAQEVSTNGHFVREHEDSIFANTAGTADTRGLEYGDSDTRTTWQGKAGLVFNPLGPGIYSRPSLRLLYGIQHSNENNAFSNEFVTTLDQYSAFGTVEQHWHHMLALEAEAWF
jgi:hypothetical protein